MYDLYKEKIGVCVYRTVPFEMVLTVHAYLHDDVLCTSFLFIPLLTMLVAATICLPQVCLRWARFFGG